MTKIEKLTKDELIILIENSKSIKEILLKIGYKNTGTYLYNVFNNLLKKYDINDPKYKPRPSNIDYKNYELNEIFIENSNFKNRNSIKKKLLKYKILEYKCAKCSISNWLDHPITLQLEHKNGINNDNRIENLEFLCPNCHSQTSTYCGRNIKFEENFCKCGDRISRKKSKCRKCILEKMKETNFNNRKIKNRPSLEEISSNVKEHGYSKTGRIYGVSDNTIRKWLI
jgi:hypothetical protein